MSNSLARRLLAALAAALGLALASCRAQNPAAPAVAPAAPASWPEPGPDGKVRLTEAEWRARLTPEQFHILRASGTERAGCGAYWKTDGKVGVYRCAGCGLVLFDSRDKFDSGTGWPSFSRPAAPGRVVDRVDDSFGMVRTENLCARCDGHIGHVFEDGPAPTGLRYCINSGALLFEPADAGEKTAAGKAQP